jgi:signal transduction histidine kinase
VAPSLSSFDSAAGGPQLWTWRTTTAIRVFALAIAIGTVIADGALVSAFPMLVVLAMIAAASSLLEWNGRSRLTHWHSVAEAVAVTILICAAAPAQGLGAYLAVPAVVAGVRHGLVTTLNVTLLSGLAAAATITFTRGGDVQVRAASILLWLAIGLGVGLLASWQSRSTRDLAARQAPYAAAHQLMARLHRLASSGSLGLDSSALALDLEGAMLQATGAARAAVFVLDSDGQLRGLGAPGDNTDLANEVSVPESERSPGAAVVPLHGAHQVLGYCVLAGFSRWTRETESAAQDLADDFAVRLDTAVLFDEIRHISASEERNRIARDMHDGVAQEIVALGYVVDEIESVSAEPETKRLAADLRDEITRVVTELRYSIFDLRHQVAEHDVTAALTDYVQELSRDTDLRVHLVLDNSAADLPARAQSELMRIAQEAIGNVRRHAQATHLWVSLVADCGAVRLEVADDGVGNASPRDRHWGLQTMHERARGLGAKLSIETRTGGGTVVRLITPPPLPTPRESTA